jgi:CubicO group peptidase (beta-lactamase class C family)
MLFGAYLLEKTGGTLAPEDIKALTMKTGYTNLNPLSCSGTATVQDCFVAGTNSTYNVADDGMFSYNGGHFQKRAVDQGLGPDGNVALAAEFKSVLGKDLPISFSSPQLAGGVVTTPSGYALFLRKLLDQTLRLGARLGEGAVCTLPSACSTATSSPIPEAWHYAYGHWIEDDPTTGDGSFSSPGAFGFYPWIDSSKRYYGILARQDSSVGAALDSVHCGRVIRKAFMAGIQQ